MVITNVHEKVKESEEVQFYWRLLSSNIDDHEQSQELLSEIITLWVTVRGFSLTASWMEEVKNKENTGLQYKISIQARGGGKNNFQSLKHRS